MPGDLNVLGLEHAIEAHVSAALLLGYFSQGNFQFRLYLLLCSHFSF